MVRFVGRLVFVMRSTWGLRRAARDRLVSVLAVLGVSLGLIVVSAPLATAEGPYAAGARVDLRVLVLSDGTPWVEAIRSQLVTEGVPTTTVNLSAGNRPRIDTAFLSDAAANHARFQAVVVADQNPALLTEAERVALIDFEKKYQVRRVNAFVWSNPTVGLNTPVYAGRLDGRTATVTAQGRAGAFKYLNGPVRFEDTGPAVDESYGYLATPVSPPAADTTLTPLLTMPTPDGSAQGVLVGQYNADGRQQLVMTFAYNFPQSQFKILAHGVVAWATRGLHLGYQRNYFSIHIDDTFSSDNRWSVDADCTPGEGDCPPGVPATTPIRMTPADVTAAVEWQRRSGIKLDQYFNAFGSDVFRQTSGGTDPLMDAFLANKSEFRWANHTWSHLYLGCERDFSVIPWRCVKNADGSTKWVTKARILDEIQKNLDWARAKGIPVNKTELLSGEHSGMRILPQQPEDNPNFVAALTEKGIKVIGSDASRDFNARRVGSATTISRYPTTLYFNVGTKAEMTDEYNWIYTSRSNGGSGICEDNPATSTCIAPLNAANGFDSYIKPLEIVITMRHMLGNDPRPHYIHQNNLAEERLAYPMLDAFLGAYRAAFTTATPLVNPTMAEAQQAQARLAAWQGVVDTGTVTAYVKDGTVTVNAPSGRTVPISVPNGTKKLNLLGLTSGDFGESYAGFRSGWQSFGTFSGSLRLRLPDNTGI